ncbi:unnamed protein product [Pseudo-nitzschia multistriata]|uniref:Uncharacterized protein n=1 Tax=Pseudo-nitzschia multistriata TaxID=183589 RepID=A0A448Z6R2_9STRA|nr:unnamed protein product [Pseudo-nitzschia multistriata]
MAIIKLSSPLFAIVASALISNVAAFTPAFTPAILPTGSRGSFTAVRMAEEDLDGAQVTSARKELKFDDKTGRFFETDIDLEECIPEEEFCTIDEDTGSKIRLTVAEKERIFLDALQSYYATGRQLLSDEDFDLLKEDLQWNGSDVVVVNRQETAYLAAMEAYLKGQPIMDDAEFDKLKEELKESGSKFAVDTEPKCYIDSGVCKVTLQEDKFRSNLLYLPAGLTLSVVWLGLAFELIEPFIRVNPIILFALGLPLIVDGSKKITEELIFTDKLIAYGPCPSCEYENRIYFGDILGVEGFGDEGSVKCPNCKTVFTVQRKTLRASTLPK